MNDRHDQSDGLPPHSDEAEAAVLGCCLLAPAECVPQVRERLAGKPEAFYDLRYREVYSAMVQLDHEGVAPDVVSLPTRLKERGTLQQVGGLAMLSALPDYTPTAANLPYYLDIIWTKFLARLALQQSIDRQQALMERGVFDETTLARMDREQEELRALARTGAVCPDHLARPLAFGDEFFNLWFKRRAALEGYELPVPLADLRIRPSELIVVTAEPGQGKTTWLGHLAVCLAAQGAKICLAALEEPVPQTLWGLSRQALGSADWHLPDNDASLARVRECLEWLDERFLLYNFLGIGNWRDILDAFRYAHATLGYRIFILDSFAKIGIPDDDYAQQAVAANAFSDFCLLTGCTLFLVVHQNKAEGKDVNRKVRGVGIITAVAKVVLSIRRNEKKGEKREGLVASLRTLQGTLDHPATQGDLLIDARQQITEVEADLAKLRLDWDTEIRMTKQNFKGAQWQNASRRIWFDWPSQQFRAKPEDGTVNYIKAEGRRQNAEKENE